MLYRLSAMEVTSFRQISAQTGKSMVQIRSLFNDLMTINVTGLGLSDKC